MKTKNNFFQLFATLIAITMVLPKPAFSSDQSTTLTPTETNIPVTANIGTADQKFLASNVQSSSVKTFQVKPDTSKETTETVAMNVMLVHERVAAKGEVAAMKQAVAKQLSSPQLAAVDQKLKDSLKQVTAYEANSNGDNRMVILAREVEVQFAFAGEIPQSSVKSEKPFNEQEYKYMLAQKEDKLLEEMRSLATAYKLTDTYLKQSMTEMDALDSKDSKREERLEEILNKFFKKLDEAVESVRAFYLPQADKGILQVSEVRMQMRKFENEMLNASKTTPLVTPELIQYFLDIAMTSYEDIYTEIEKVNWEKEALENEDNKSLLIRFFDFYQMRHPWLNILLRGQYATKAEIDYLSEIIEKLYNESDDKKEDLENKSVEQKVDTMILHRLLMPAMTALRTERNDFWMSFTKPELIDADKKPRRVSRRN